MYDKEYWDEYFKLVDSSRESQYSIAEDSFDDREGPIRVMPISD